MFDALLELLPEEGRVVCRMPTHDALPLTDAQRVHPLYHPRHVAGGLLVHASGMLGFVHAYHLLGLRHHEGWIGYGTHIHNLVFRKLIEPGEPVIASCQAVRSRIGTLRHLIRYKFAMHHKGALAYESEQTAAWVKVTSEEERNEVLA